MALHRRLRRGKVLQKEARRTKERERETDRQTD